MRGGGFFHSSDSAGDFLAVLRLVGAAAALGVIVNCIHLAVVAGNF